jgi:hypothetical protein
MGPEAPSPSWLKEKIRRIFYIIKGRRTSSTVLKKLCEEDLTKELPQGSDSESLTF